MNALEIKLMKLGMSGDIARSLVSAGFSTPKLIKSASDQEIDAAVGKDYLETVRNTFGSVANLEV